jgi:Inner membrane component of T3SS, cytoplasmic domain/zinc-ribbon domain
MHPYSRLSEGSRMNCPACHRQNVDTAKFCGNCGTPFPREDLVSSSLVNCGHGHIYSAVYDRCPYCPASESLEPAATAADKRRARSADLGRWGKGTGDLTGGLSAADPVVENRSRRETGPSSDGPTSVDIPPQLRLADKPEMVESANAVDSKAYRMPSPPPPPPVQPSSATSPAPRPSEDSNSTDRRTVVISVDDVKQTSDRRLVGWLVTFTDHPEGKDFRLRAGVNRIGARGQCDIIIDDDAVSSSHALIVWREGECSIRDDFSTNGTFVNDIRVTETQKISSNDRLRVGNTELQLILIAP